MKRFLAFLVILSHFNFTMFIPQMDETDTYRPDGEPVEDINSLFQYVDHIVLGHKNANPIDTDDDTARFFHVVKSDSYCFNQLFLDLGNSLSTSAHLTEYFPYTEQKLSAVYFEIQSPPPEV